MDMGVTDSGSAGMLPPLAPPSGEAVQGQQGAGKKLSKKPGEASKKLLMALMQGQVQVNGRPDNWPIQQYNDVGLLLVVEPTQVQIGNTTVDIVSDQSIDAAAGAISKMTGVPKNSVISELQSVRDTGGVFSIDTFTNMVQGQPGLTPPDPNYANQPLPDGPTGTGNPWLAGNPIVVMTVNMTAAMLIAKYNMAGDKWFEIGGLNNAALLAKQTVQSIGRRAKTERTMLFVSGGVKLGQGVMTAGFTVQQTRVRNKAEGVIGERLRKAEENVKDKKVKLDQLEAKLQRLTKYQSEHPGLEDTKLANKIENLPKKIQSAKKAIEDAQKEVDILQNPSTRHQEVTKEFEYELYKMQGFKAMVQSFGDSADSWNQAINKFAMAQEDMMQTNLRMYEKVNDQAMQDANRSASKSQDDVTRYIDSLTQTSQKMTQAMRMTTN